MERQVYLNEVPNVRMYASEGGINNGNCASGCSGCTNNSGSGSGSDIGTELVVGGVVAVVGGVLTTTIGGAIAGPPGAVAASTAGPGPTIA